MVAARVILLSFAALPLVAAGFTPFCCDIECCESDDGSDYVCCDACAEKQHHDDGVSEDDCDGSGEEKLCWCSEEPDPPDPPSPPSPPPPPRIPARSIYSTYSGKCLDIPGGDATNGQFLWVWECSEEYAGQRWDWNNYQIQFGDSCVDVPNGDLTNGNSIELWDCNGLPQQQWGYDESVGTIYIASNNAVMCLQIDGFGDGTFVQLWDCNNMASNQYWSLGSGSQALVA
jgi:hypothetical protein